MSLARMTAHLCVLHLSSGTWVIPLLQSLGGCFGSLVFCNDTLQSFDVLGFTM